MAITFKPLSAALGAEVLGLDLRDEIDAETSATLVDAWHRYQVLCFPGQKIAASDQIRFCGLFGDANAERRLPASVSRRRPGAARVMLVSNIRHDGEAIGSLPDGGVEFHADGAHHDVPYMATSLYAIKVPSSGGETLFADMYAPFASLPAEKQDRLRGLRVHFIYTLDASSRESPNPKDVITNRASHDLVWRHPETGRESLYLGRLMTQWIEGMDRAESDALIAELLELVERPEYVYAHRWTPGDLVLWDNRCVNHARATFPEDQDRLLRRYTIN